MSNKVTLELSKEELAIVVDSIASHIGEFESGSNGPDLSTYKKLGSRLLHVYEMTFKDTETFKYCTSIKDRHEDNQ